MRMTGTPRYIASGCYFDDIESITLGERVVISTNVAFLTHDYSLTTALIAAGRMPKSDIAVTGEIKVGENVFIGRGSIILPGSQIGSHVIIGSGTVVRGQVPSYSVVNGNPSRVIGDIRDLLENQERLLNTELVRQD
jgi:acetyltransferase-like isoleucine patch superfamily enzyme